MKPLLIIPLLLLGGCTPQWGDTSPEPSVVGPVSHVAQPRTMVSAPAPLVQLQWVNATNCPATNYEVIVWQSTDLKNWSVAYDGTGVTNCYLPMNQQKQFFKLSAQYAGRLTALTSAQIDYRRLPLVERMKLRAALAERTRETVAAIKLD